MSGACFFLGRCLGEVKRWSVYSVPRGCLVKRAVFRSSEQTVQESGGQGEEVWREQKRWEGRYFTTFKSRDHGLLSFCFNCFINRATLASLLSILERYPHAHYHIITYPFLSRNFQDTIDSSIANPISNVTPKSREEHVNSATLVQSYDSTLQPKQATLSPVNPPVSLPQPLRSPPIAGPRKP